MVRVSCAALALLLVPAAASAGIVLSQAIVDIGPTAPTAQDIDVSNDGKEVAYVVAEPYEITSPGTPDEKRVRIADPATGGLLVSPQKLILQPGEHKLVRIAAVVARQASDRIYRVTIKPVAGSVSAPSTALKLMVGYDALVIYRPQAPVPDIVAARSGKTLTLTNRGNTNAELYDGTQCPTAGATAGCTKLLPRRLYAGAQWTQTLPGDGPVTYHLASGPRSDVLHF
jgi:P pilus assembly chaperone PapD